MSTSTFRRALLALVPAAALMVGSFAAAAPADASTLYACVKKNGAAHVYSKKPKCKKGESKLSWNASGPAGKNGANGNNGNNGSNGSNGKDGAVAAFGVKQTEEIDLTKAEGLTQVPGMTKTLPAGAFIVTGTIHVSGISVNNGEYASAECAVVDVPSGGSPTQNGNVWSGPTGPIFIFHIAQTVMPLSLAVNTTVPSTLGVQCREAGRGEKTEIKADSGSIYALQVSSIG
jgi:hypothetical protein